MKSSVDMPDLDSGHYFLTTRAPIRDSGDDGHTHASCTQAVRIALAKSGHDVIDWPVYETVFADHFPDDIAAAIGRGDLLAIVTFSARTSEAFAALMKDAGLWHLRSNIIVIAGSKAIGDAAGAGWREVIVARAPKRSRILAIATLVYRRYLRDDAAPRKR